MYIQRAQSGDREAFDKLVAAFEPKIQNAIDSQKSLVRDDGAMRSACLIGFRQAVHSYVPGRSTFAGWLNRYLGPRVKRYLEEAQSPHSWAGYNSYMETECPMDAIDDDIDTALAVMRSLPMLTTDELRVMQLVFMGESEPSDIDLMLRIGACISRAREHGKWPMDKYTAEHERARALADAGIEEEAR